MISPRPAKSSRIAHLAFCVFAVLIGSAVNAQVPRGYPGRPLWADTAKESNVYPVGDAVGVYTAVLDLYFIDGAERPSTIVMHDTAEGRRGGPCPMQCPEAWLHKSKIELSTMLAFAKLSPKRPKMVPFGYPVPIAYLSYEQANVMRVEGAKILEAEHRSSPGTGDDLLVAISKRFPGAWGFITLSKVGFNDSHSEALISVNFFCGVACSDEENLFLKRIDKRWVVIERIPNDAQGLQPWIGMRYRGPIGDNPGGSEILPASRSQRTEGEDAVSVYETVLDSLYRFHGEQSRRVVVTDWFSVDLASNDSLPHQRPIQASTLARYKFLRGVRAPLNVKLKLRVPVSVLPRDSMPRIEQLGKPLEKMVLDRMDMTETSPFWLEFRRHYPGAWGMVGFTRAAFNDDRTQALVFTSHACGQNCRNDDTWLVERTGDQWRIAERIPRSVDKEWMLDSLRYLGVDANPRAYRTRRLRGVFVTKPGGVPLQNLRFTARVHRDSLFLTSDATGRFEISNLPLFGGIFIAVPCQHQPVLRNAAGEYGSRPVSVAELVSHPALDTTVTIPVDFRRCLLHRRAVPLIGAKPAPQSLASGYPDATDAAVYRGVFDALYPGGLRGPIMLSPQMHRLWEYDFEPELFRLEKQGVVDSTLQPRLRRLPHEPVWLRPNASYGRKVIVLGPAEQKFLEEQAGEFGETGEQRDLSLNGMIKEAYPGADKLLWLSRVAYNERIDQAIVQVGPQTGNAYDEGETMILHKTGNLWRVVRRHVEKEATSGDMIAGRCEPVDAKPTVPSFPQLERFVGDADITAIPTSLNYRKYAGTGHYRFTPTDTLQRFYWTPPKGDNRPPERMKYRQKLAVVQAVDSTGKPLKERPGSLDVSPLGATIGFFGDPDMVDGPYEEFHILRVNGRQFFGEWESGSGAGILLKGFFCGRLR